MVNPYWDQLEVVVEPRLDAANSPATTFYLAADPTVIDGIETRVLLDFGCGAIDHRFAVKSAGT